MEPQEWVKRVKQRLGWPVVKLATTDDMIQDIVKQTIEKIEPFLTEAEYITGQPPTVDLRDKGVYAVVHVYRSRGTVPVPAQGLVDEFTLINYAPYARMGNALAEIMVRNLYRTELTALVPEDWKLIDGMLYVSGYTGEITIEAITTESTKKMSNRFQQWCFDYSLALLKQTEGEIRSKVKVEGSPVTTNGEDLKKEGREEQTRLEDMLGTDLSLFFAMR